MTPEEKRNTKVSMQCYGNKPNNFFEMLLNGNILVAIINSMIYNQSNDILYLLIKLLINIFKTMIQC